MENNFIQDKTTKNTEANEYPEWLTSDLFEEFLKRDYNDFKQITNFVVEPAVKTGENYLTIMLRAKLEVALKNSKVAQMATFMIKIKPATENMQQLIQEWQLFRKEQIAYSQLIPAYEKYYQNIGCSIKFAPNLLQSTNKQIAAECLILEDLKPNGFRNANRQQGLDMQHTKAVLKKLAQLHAASACYFEKNGAYDEIYEQSFKSDKDLIKDLRLTSGKLLIESLPKYGNFEYLKDKLVGNISI